MDSLTVRDRIRGFFEKYKYVVLVLAVGLVLMMLPDGKEESATESVAEVREETQSLQQELEEILGKIDGVGKVKVLLTIAEGESVLYQTDQSTNGVETVIVTDTSKAQQGLVVRMYPPTYLGAVVVCQGGDIPSVKLAVVDAVSNATGLGADKITVLKMK